MDAVLPVSRGDLRRAKLCLRSLRNVYEGLGTVWVIHEDVDSEAFAELSNTFDFLRLVRSSDVIPGRGNAPILHRVAQIVHAGCVGWYRQQMIKLAMARMVETPFYLLLDADVVCTQKMRISDLFEDGKAMAVRHEMLHPTWYRISAALLSLPPLVDEFGVTPVVLHTSTCLDLLRHLGGGRDPDDPRWVARLGRTLGWTEYSLYYTFLSHRGRLDELHSGVSYKRWFGPSVWRSWHPGEGSWSPEAAFAERNHGWFSVVSSRCGPPLEILEEMLDPYLPQ